MKWNSTLAVIAAFGALAASADESAPCVSEPGFSTLIAHRGESFDAPENTLPAYRTAVERGFGFECDIYLSKDGRLFTFHDSDLKRTTGGARTNACTDVTWDEVRRLNVGGWGKWKGSKFDGTRPALLEEVLELARPGRKIYVEVKGGDSSTNWVSAIRRVMESSPHADPEKVLFIAFGAKTCAELRRQLPQYKVYWLFRQTAKNPRSAESIIETLRASGATGVDMKYIPSVVTAEYIAKVRSAGFEFHVWTIDDPATAAEALGRGAMTVTTNRARFINTKELSTGLRETGRLPRRDASTPPAESNWRLGCETLDRDFADYDAYRDYLVPLGIRTVRLQGGWAKCERTKGVYDFAWLDHIVDDLIAKGLEPAIETDYGNPIYEGGGDADLAGGFPTSEVALAAWDGWVEALTRHFAGRVGIWMMWNEPDYSKGRRRTPQEIAEFNVRTAKIVKRVLPDSRIAGLSLAKNDPKLLEDCLRAMGADAGLFDWIVYHGYETAPETSYARVEELKRVLAKYAPKARLWQGENGCPSERTYKFALSGVPWTEISQAKWDLRRMLGDLGHDVESSIFTICDFNHLGREMNRKGLLRADEAKRVTGPKLAYFAVQNLTSVFDASLTRDRGYRVDDPILSAYRYLDGEGRPLVVFWTHRFSVGDKDFARPCDSFETREVPRETLALPDGELEWVDLLSGRIFAVPAERATVPAYDSPCFVRVRKR